MNNKTRNIIIVAIVALVLAAGVTQLINKPEVTTQEAANQEKAQINAGSKVSEMAKKLGATDKKDVAYQMISAKDGAKYSIGETKIEIYEFEDANLADGLKYLYDVPEAEVRRSGNVVVLVHGDATTADAIASKF